VQEGESRGWFAFSFGDGAGVLETRGDTERKGRPGAERVVWRRGLEGGPGDLGESNGSAVEPRWKLEGKGRRPS